MSKDVACLLPSSSQAGEPLRKRPRLSDTEDNETDPKDSPEPKTKTEVADELSMNVRTATRDDKYYFSDGSCTLKVEDTLFNVHKTILSRDSSSFSSLFSLPQGGQISEGTSDSNPITLEGDTLSEFRNFLWAMYAMPYELKLISDAPSSDMPKLLDIAKLGNKYSFTSLESWACDALQANVSSRPSSIDESNPEHRLLLTRIVRIAYLCQHAGLLKSTAVMLQERLGSSTTCLSLALSLCVELESEANWMSDPSSIRTLIGAAHFAALMRGPTFWDAPEIQLAPSVKLRLLTGYYNLTRKSLDIQTGSVPTFSHSSQCVAFSRQHCTMSWQAFWRDSVSNNSVTKLNLADVGGRIKVLLSAIDHWAPWGQANVMHHECKKEMKQQLYAQMRDFQDNLVDYFLST